MDSPIQLNVFCYTEPDSELSFTFQNSLKQFPLLDLGGDLKSSRPLKFRIDWISFRIKYYWIFLGWNRKQKQAKIYMFKRTEQLIEGQILGGKTKIIRSNIYNPTVIS